MPGEHLVEDDAEAVEIGARVERLALRLLGTHVVRRAAQHAGARAAVAGQQAARQAEVDEHHAAVVAQHDVRRLQIAMDDAGLVHHLERARDFLEEGDGLVGGQRILQARLEVAAGEIFHREVFDALVDAVVEQVDDRRMIERGDGFELALEHDGALAGVVDGVAARVFALGDLQRDVVAEVFGDREVHGRRFGLADLLQDGVARESGDSPARSAWVP